jgi:nitroreductase
MPPDGAIFHQAVLQKEALTREDIRLCKDRVAGRTDDLSRDGRRIVIDLAQYAPSNSYIQPWHLVFASGPPRDRLVAALLDEAKRRPPNIPPLPVSFQHYRRELGAQVYGAMGIAREDTAGHTAAVLRNWEFFRAPLAGIVCMHRDLGPADALSVGMYLQTLLLALTERGLGTCIEVSVAGYPEIVRAQLAIPAELSILCGLAVGYPDPDFPANRLHISREAVEKNVVILDS